MKSVTLVALAALAAATASEARPERVDLDKECSRAIKVYLNLMLAVMLEGPVNCGNPETDEVVDCHASETPAEAAARARRLAVRKYQEAGYEPAHDACMAYNKDKASEPLRQAALAAIAEARKRDRGPLPTGE
jgi:hypothetical protein